MQEFFIYLQFSIIPHLRDLLANDSSLFIFLGVLIEYAQIKDSQDICHRWSSFRNKSWLLSWILSEEEKEECLNTLLNDFIDSVYGDLEDMLQQESGKFKDVK